MRGNLKLTFFFPTHNDHGSFLSRLPGSFFSLTGRGLIERQPIILAYELIEPESLIELGNLGQKQRIREKSRFPRRAPKI